MYNQPAIISLRLSLQKNNMGTKQMRMGGDEKEEEETGRVDKLGAEEEGKRSGRCQTMNAKKYRKC